MKGTSKRVLGILLAFCLVFALAPATAAAEEPWQGSGTEEDPWLISTAQDLTWLSLNVNNNISYEGRYFALAQNIDMGSQLWTPIGHTKAFNGTFDGQNNSVYNLYITGFQNAGFFGFLGSSGVVKNLGVGGNLSGGVADGITCIGGVASMSRGTIVSCAFAGSVTVSGNVNYAGGIVGYNEGTGQVKGCSSTGTITAKDGSQNYAGGILGMNYQGTLGISRNKGAVTASGGDTNCAGGIVGYNWDAPDPNVDIDATYNEGAVKASGGRTNYMGAIVGYNNIPGAVNTPIIEEPVVTQPEPWVNPFGDVQESDWFYESVAFVSENGLMNGVSVPPAEPQFAPSATLNRATIVTVLWRMEGSPAPVGGMAFSDVPEGEWYTEAVKWASSPDVGVVNGTGQNQFTPLGNLTRQQLCAIFYRYAAYKGKSLSNSTNLALYPDSFQIDDYAVEPVKWSLNKSVLRKTQAGLINPLGDATRADVAWALYKL